MIALAIGGALALFAWRAPNLEGGAAFEPASRETTLLLNNLLFCVAVAGVFVGTLYPLVLEALTGEQISVGPPYYASCSRRCSSRCWCWCRSVRGWHGGRTISDRRCDAGAGGGRRTRRRHRRLGLRLPRTLAAAG